MQHILNRILQLQSREEGKLLLMSTYDEQGQISENAVSILKSSLWDLH